jgi:hypothetical protein
MTSREALLALAEAGLRHAEGLSAQLAKPDWEPGRAHIEQARNSIQKLAELLRGTDAAQQPPGLGDIVFVAKGTPYFHDWRGVEMKLVSLRIAPEGKLWASVIDKGDPNNTRHRGFGVYDGETTDFEFDHLELATPVSSTLHSPATTEPVYRDVVRKWFELRISQQRDIAFLLNLPAQGYSGDLEWGKLVLMTAKERGELARIAKEIDATLVSSNQREGK